jgi:uncharacterized sulfatase
MKKYYFHFFVALVVLGSFLLKSCSTPEPEIPPNILLIISDDQGWTDYGFMGHPHIQTPHIDHLANESLTFTHGYVTAPLCRPSLASMVTGYYPHQHGVTGNDPTFEWEGKRWTPEWMQARAAENKLIIDKMKSHLTLAQRLGNKGYISLQTGKWWEGHWSEGGFTQGMTHGDPLREGRHGDEGLKIGREGLDIIYDFIDRSTEQEKPFFIWYAPFMPHSPHTPPDSLEQKYLEVAPSPAVARYWAMCEWFDYTCGKLVDFIDRRGLTDNTVVAYVCDNGWIQLPDKPNRYAPRSKRSPYEQGIRTPIMFRWPGKIDPVFDSLTLASSIDIVPTLLSACGLEIDQNLPGLDLLNPEVRSKRKVLFAEAFDHDIPDMNDLSKGLQYRIAIDYPWKLILPNKDRMDEAEVELFNIRDDPHETRNFASENEQMVVGMKEKLDEWWKPEQ